MLIKGKTIPKKNRNTQKALLLTTENGKAKGWKIETTLFDKPDLVIRVEIKGSGSIKLSDDSDDVLNKIEKLFAKLYAGKRKQFLLNFIDQNGKAHHLLWEKASKGCRHYGTKTNGVY